MALIKCKECGKEISKKARSCPNCGAPARSRGILKGVFVLGVFFTGLGLGASNNPPPPATVSVAPLAPPVVSQPSPKPSTLPVGAPLPVKPVEPKKKPLPFDPILAQQGEEVFKALRLAHPDFPDDGKHGAPPRTVYVLVMGEATDSPFMQLGMPRTVWDGIPEANRAALVAYVKSQIAEARAHPEKFGYIPFTAPAYASAKRNIGNMKDGAWEVGVGTLDEGGGLDIQETVLRGENRVGGQYNVEPDIPKEGPVMNSAWDGSVRQVKDYLKQHLNDPDSIQYEKWGPVMKAGWGYQVSVSYRAKNPFGAYILKQQRFTLNGSGVITEVIDQQY
jgi:hypothetical protein